MTPLTEAQVSDSAHAFLEDVSVAPEVLELRPDYRLMVMVAEGLEPGPPDEISDELLSRAETRAWVTLGGRAPEDVPQVADWRAAYRAFGAKPQRTRPSVEALLRPLDAGLPRIDRLTDAYNAVSIANLVPVGGEDLDQYEGPARLVRAAGDEDFGTTAQARAAAARRAREDLARPLAGPPIIGSADARRESGGRTASFCASMRPSATTRSHRGHTRTPGGTDATNAATTG